MSINGIGVQYSDTVERFCGFLWGSLRSGTQSQCQTLMFNDVLKCTVIFNFNVTREIHAQRLNLLVLKDLSKINHTYFARPHIAGLRNLVKSDNVASYKSTVTTKVFEELLPR